MAMAAVFFPVVASSCFPVVLTGDDCSHGPWEGERICNYNMERVRFGTAAKVCQSKGLQICTQKLEGYGCSYDDIHVWTQDQPTVAAWHALFCLRYDTMMPARFLEVCCSCCGCELCRPNKGV